MPGFESLYLGVGFCLRPSGKRVLVVNPEKLGGSITILTFLRWT